MSVPHHFQVSLVRVHSSPLSSVKAVQASIIILSSGANSQPNFILGSCATHFKPKTEVFLRNALPSFPCSSWQATSSTARITLAPQKKQLNEPGFLPPGQHRSFQLMAQAARRDFSDAQANLMERRSHKEGWGREPLFKGSLLQCASQSVAGPQQMHSLVMALSSFNTCSSRHGIWSSFLE